MSKVAEYLNQHIVGEVVTHPAVLATFSRDGSVLEIKPDMVAYPRQTSDIRKIARFAWQLREKKRAVSLIPRGGGTDTTGAAIGKGIVIATGAHMNNILEFDPKQKLVRVQPGLSSKSLNSALRLHGQGIQSLPSVEPGGTVGGAIASGTSSPLAGRHGLLDQSVWRLEVVLATGDVLQTERISKRELARKRGLTTYEGDVYREIDNLIEDNKELIERELDPSSTDSSGYAALARVKQKDGTFDLTPLFIGSQGTLGIISEVILKSDFVSFSTSAAVVSFTNDEAARDALDAIAKLSPALLEYYDADVFAAAIEQGVEYPSLKPEGLESTVKAVVVVQFDEFGDRVRAKKLKRLAKLAKQAGAAIQTADKDEVPALLAVRDAVSYAAATPKGGLAIPLFDDSYVPVARGESFVQAVRELALKHHVSLPLRINALTGYYSARPTLQLTKVGDKQKVFKLLKAWTELVDSHDGTLIANGGEGRLKASFVPEPSPEITALYEAVKQVFDPHGLLNTGVKQASPLKDLVSHLRSDYASTGEHGLPRT